VVRRNGRGADRHRDHGLYRHRRASGQRAGAAQTAITAGMVFALVGVTLVFFVVADQVMRLVVTFLLGNA
jgi:hypothetical protein